MMIEWHPGGVRGAGGGGSHRQPDVVAVAGYGTIVHKIEDNRWWWLRHADSFLPAISATNSHKNN